MQNLTPRRFWAWLLIGTFLLAQCWTLPPVLADEEDEDSEVSPLPSWMLLSIRRRIQAPIEIGPLIEQGKKALVDRDPMAAFRAFRKAHLLDSQNPEVHFYLAVSRLLSWPPRHRRLIRQLEITGPQGARLQETDLNPFRWTAVFPQALVPPSRFSTGAKVQEFLRRDWGRTLRRSLSNLARVPTGFQSTLPLLNPLTGAMTVEIDDADVALARAFLHLGLAELYQTQLYNVDVDLADLNRRRQQEGTIRWREDLLFPYPNLGRIQDATQAQRAKGAILAAIDDYLAADTFLRNETDDQREDLILFSNRPQDQQKAAVFRRELANLKKSLTGLSDAGWTLTFDQLLHVGDFFDRPLDIRSLERGQGIQEAFVSYLHHQSQRAMENLRKAPFSFSEPIDADTLAVTSITRPLEVDYGDVLATQTLLESLNAVTSLLAGYDLDVATPEVAMQADAGTLDVQKDLLDPYPFLFKIRDLTRFPEAKLSSRQATQVALDASHYLRSREDADQKDDLSPFTEEWAPLEAHWRAQLERLERTFSGTIDLDPSQTTKELRVNLNPLLDGQLQLRELLPKFEGISPIPGTLPDPTLGGTLPDFTQDDWDLRR